MTEAQTTDTLKPSAPEIELTPESGMAISDHLSSSGFALFGHGTPFEDASSFFENGIQKSGYQLSSVALAIGTRVNEERNAEHPQSETIADKDFMDHWPHQRGDEPPNVVLMAVPNPDHENEVYASMIDHHLIGDEEVETNFDPKLVVGFYRPGTGKIEMNPDFTASEGLRMEHITAIRENWQLENDRIMQQLNRQPAESKMAGLAIGQELDRSDEPVGDVW